ncbi:MAG: hypothetical protein J2P13_11605, partial [Acidobacteria bacterium]|nr:hypothetical protein [Acidobacteriota bacterium]
AEQQMAQKENAQWESEIKKLSTLEQVNDMLVNVKTNAPKPVQAKFNKRAKELGYVFDKETGAYFLAEKPKEGAHA